MQKQYFNQLLTLLVSFIFVSQSFAEGTAQLTPTLASDNQGVLQIWPNDDPNRNSFTYGSATDKRLQFTIYNPETVYFGMNYDAADLTGTSSLWYRIISPSNTVVFPVTGGWQQITNTGAGSISSWQQAVAGPNNIVGGTGGYSPLSFNAAEPGDFYIEFYRNSLTTAPVNTPIAATSSSINGQEKKQTRLRFFDLTITDVANGNRIPGRLFSKLWEINTNGSNNPFNTSMYVYTDSGITSQINFNGIRSTNLVIACNEFGVSNTGNTFEDVQSVTGQSITPQYKIFLAAPALDSYPTGILGEIVNHTNITITGTNPTQLCINIVVDKAGTGSVLLNFNGIPGYQPGTSDLLLDATYAVGTNCIVWDCKDGLGNIVVPGTTVELRVNYINGAYNLPLYDVANNPNGIIVSLIRPAGPTPLLLWNDSQLTDGTINTAGCTSASPAGCHAWGSDVAGNIPSGNAPADWGLGKTINTTWNANSIGVSATYTIPNFVSLSLPSTATNVDITAAPFALTGGSPAGGTYSGTGVTNGIFDPAAAGLGDHDITYTYTYQSSVPSLATGRITSVDYTYSTTQTITVESSTTTGNAVASGIVIKGMYPNPNKGNFNIVGSEGMKLTIYNATSQMVQTTEITSANQSVTTDLNQGMYYFTLQGNSDNSFSGSFIVQ